MALLLFEKMDKALLLYAFSLYIFCRGCWETFMLPLNKTDSSIQFSWKHSPLRLVQSVDMMIFYIMYNPSAVYCKINRNEKIKLRSQGQEVIITNISNRFLAEYKQS